MDCDTFQQNVMNVRVNRALCYRGYLFILSVLTLRNKDENLKNVKKSSRLGAFYLNLHFILD